MSEEAIVEEAPKYDAGGDEKWLAQEKRKRLFKDGCDALSRACDAVSMTSIVARGVGPSDAVQVARENMREAERLFVEYLNSIGRLV